LQGYLNTASAASLWYVLKPFKFSHCPKWINLKCKVCKCIYSSII
jgi:hypothetical protein